MGGWVVLSLMDQVQIFLILKTRDMYEGSEPRFTQPWGV